MTINKTLLNLIERTTRTIDVPPVSRLYVPEPNPGPDRHTEFGVVELADGAAGLYYAWLGDTQKGMATRFASAKIIGASPLTLVRLFDSTNDADRSLGLAAINAISQSVYRRAGMALQTATDSMATLRISTGDHIGMVGYFPSLVRRLQARDIPVTIIERKNLWTQQTGKVAVTMDVSRLSDCNKILCTASTVLNGTVDGILNRIQHAEVTVVIGPTMGFYPDPLFARGIAAIGGTEVLDAAAVIDALQHGQGLGEAARRYVIERDTYPGVASLLAQIGDDRQIHVK